MSEKSTISKKVIYAVIGVIMFLIVAWMAAVIFAVSSEVQEMSSKYSMLEKTLEEEKNRVSDADVIKNYVTDSLSLAESSKWSRDEHLAQADLYDQQYKSNIWASRCWTKNSMLNAQWLELEDCSENLERFANYDSGK